MAEDINIIRLKSRAITKTPFHQSWQFRVEIEDYPHGADDFDLFVKDITYGPIEIETDALKIGFHTLTFPAGAAPVGISMTMRDHQDQRVYGFCNEWSDKIINDDGTVNLPSRYLKKWTRYAIMEDSSEKMVDVWEVFLTQVGDVSESRDEPGIMEFPVTLIQFYC
ncbi:MAG TPA: hypothetical protein ENN86_02500 [Desulfobacteraceae bacterium]|nr:hypothetical protein [Desulfobacteraceae bacterium]